MRPNAIEEDKTILTEFLLKNPQHIWIVLVPAFLGLVLHHYYWRVRDQKTAPQDKEKYLRCILAGLAIYVLAMAYTGIILAFDTPRYPALVAVGTFFAALLLYLMMGCIAHGTGELSDQIIACYGRKKER